jgi:hypothetical protein
MNYVLYYKIPYYICINIEILCTLFKFSMTVYYYLIPFPTNLMSYLCTVVIKLLLLVLYCQGSVCNVPIIILMTSSISTLVELRNTE